MLFNFFTEENLAKFLILFACFTLPIATTVVSENTNDNLLLTDNLLHNELEPKVHDAEYALNKLMSYYTLWYRSEYKTPIYLFEIYVLIFINERQLSLTQENAKKF